MDRPKGWENPFNFMDGSVIPGYELQSKAYEAGADAYEEALKSECRISIEPGQIVQTDKGAYRWHQFDVKGYLVFIPEEG